MVSRFKNWRWWVALPLMVLIVILFVAPYRIVYWVAEILDVTADYIESYSERALEAMGARRLYNWIKGNR